MKPQLYTLDLQLRRPGGGLPPLASQFDELYRFAIALGKDSELLRRWYLLWSTKKDDALTYEAFDAAGPAPDALSVVEAEFQGVHDIHTISLWNGAQAKSDGVALKSMCSVLGRPDQISLRLKERPEVNDWKVAARWLEVALGIWSASFISYGPFWYSEKAVFQDKPGVSWMLYLPRVLTADQVPEARALVPVVDAKGVEGTIIVSVTDAPFSLENPEHVATANAIEVRLTDLDVLPRYADL